MRSKSENEKTDEAGWKTVRGDDKISQEKTKKQNKTRKETSACRCNNVGGNGVKLSSAKLRKLATEMIQ